jgi:hypothetical protein
MDHYTRDNPSPRFKLLGDLYHQLHDSGHRGGRPEQTFSGKSLLPHIGIVRELARHTNAHSILDYGSGKGALYSERNLPMPQGGVISSVQEYWGVGEIWLYDPGVDEYAVRPDRQFDGVVSTDVLEHIPEEDIDWVLNECFDFARKFVYMNIASYPAVKMLPNGWNAHLTVKPPAWWRRHIEKAAAGWMGRAYVFDVSEKYRGFARTLVRTVTGRKLKLTRIEKWT